MLEIIALVTLTRRIGEIVREKGRKSGWYKFMTVMMWFGGEIVGAIVGAFIAAATGTGALITYVCALAGAGLGAGGAYLIAISVPALHHSAPPSPPVFK